MKKRYLSILLAVLLLLALSVIAYAEESQDEVSAAATTNSISLVSIDSFSYNSIRYTINLNVTDSLAQQGYFLGMEYSNNTDFQTGPGKTLATDSDPTLLYTPYDNYSKAIYRTSVCLVPNVTYYLRPVMYSSDRSLVFRSSNWFSFPGPADDSQYTSLALYDEYSADRGWLYGKFVAPANGTYALTSGHNYDFITWIKAGATSSGSVGSNGSSDPLTLFFDASAGETVYLFGYSPNFSSSECIRVVRAEDAAPSSNTIEVGDPFDVTATGAKFSFTISTTPATATNGYQVGIVYGEPGTDPETWQGKVRIYTPETEVKNNVTRTYGTSRAFSPGMDVEYQAALFDANSDMILARGSYIGHLQTVVPTKDSIEVGDAFDITNMAAKFPFTISTTPTTAQNGYQVGIIFGDHGTDPLTWEITGRIYQPEYTIKSSTQMTYGSSSICVPGLDIDYQAALLDLNSDTILARGNYVGHLVASNDISNMTPLTAGSEFTWTDRTKVLYFAVPQSGMYQIHGENMGRFKVLNQKAKTFCDTGDQSEYDCSIYAKMGETLYIYTGKQHDNSSSITVSYDSSKIADTQQLQAAISAGETYLNLDDYGSFEITGDVTVPAGTTLSFEGTELVIAQNATLEIQGTSKGDRIRNSGTLRISEDSASFRTDERLTMTATGHMEVDGHGFVEIVSNSTSNNDYLNPLMDMRFANGGSVTFGYFIPSEDYMRSLLARLDNSNPNIRLDLQFFCGINLSQDLTLPEHVTLHTDTYWSQGEGFTIPQGVTLTIPESNAFYSFGTAIDIQGNLINNGEVFLGASGDGPNGPMILNMSLAAGGNYSGGGVVTIQDLDNPLSYMDGFTGYRFEEAWLDETNDMVSYRLFRTYDFRDNGQGSYTLPGDLTVNPFERLLADELIIPYGVTLRIYGGNASIGTALVIEQGGALIIDSNGRVDLYGPPASTDVAGSILLLNYSQLNMSLGHWTNANIKDAIQVAGEDSVINVGLEIRANNQSGWEDVLHNVMAQGDIPAALQGFVHKECSLCIPYTPTEDFVIPAGIEFRVLNNGSDESGSLTIPQGVTLTVPEGGYLGLCASDLTVYGAISNNGRVELMTRNGDPDGTLAIFTLADGAVYSGNGQIWVKSYQNDPEQSLVGFINGRLFVLIRDAMGGQYRYIANKSSDNILVLPASTRTIEEEAFAGTAAQEVQLPSTIESIGSRAFADADSLELVVIPVASLEIDPTAFAGSDNVIITAPAAGSVQEFADQNQIPFMPFS